MPVIRNESVVELIRGLKAFLRLEAGLTRGPLAEGGASDGDRLLDLNRRLGHERERRKALEEESKALRVRVRGLSEELGREKEEQRRRAERLKQARERLAEKDRQIAQFVPTPGGNGAGEVMSIVNRFHKLYYDSNASGGTWHDTFWMGVPIWKCPLDLWVYQEILFDLKPDAIIETGTAFGGSALFLAGICDLLDKGRIVTIDIEDKPGRPKHERVQYMLGSSTAKDIVDEVRRSVDGSKVLVILDSDHSKEHVLDELRTYSPFVEEGGYIIVEDTNINGHPVLSEFGPGPMEAVEDFLKANEDFVVDDSKEKFYMTFNPKGYLRKVK